MISVRTRSLAGDHGFYATCSGCPAHDGVWNGRTYWSGKNQWADPKSARSRAVADKKAHESESNKAQAN